MTRSKRKKSKMTFEKDDEKQQQQGGEGGLKVFASSYRLATFDVMCGRNKVAEAHRGNKRFRALVEKHCLHYMNEDTTREERRSIVTNILDQVVGKGGYFLKQEYEGGEFLEISIKYAREKIVHSLRDTCLKLQSTMEVPVTTKETPSTPSKNSVPGKKSSMTPIGEDAVSIATTQAEESDRDSTTSKADEQAVSEGEVTFKSYQSNTSTLLEGIDDCRIRRKRHCIDCKPRKKPKQSGTSISIPVRGKDHSTKHQKKQASLAHRKLGKELPVVSRAQSDKTTFNQGVVGISTNPTVKGNGIDALAAHRALVMAAMQAEKASNSGSSPMEISFQSSPGRTVTPQQGLLFMSPPSNIVQADSSALGDPLPAFNNVFQAPSSSLFSTFIPVVKGPSTTQIQQSIGDYHTSPHSKGTKRKHLVPPLINNPVSVSQRNDTSLTTNCRSDIPESSPHQRPSYHALILEETEDERISCWGEYC